jgi:hypothetical protein
MSFTFNSMKGMVKEMWKNTAYICGDEQSAYYAESHGN